jgi:hypothetical protein
VDPLLDLPHGGRTRFAEELERRLPAARLLYWT